MAIPSFQEITLPLLQLAADGTVHHLSEARTHLAVVFELTPEEQDEKLPSGKQGRFANRVAWAKVYLEKAGILASSARGQFQITERGREVLKNPPMRLDIQFMERFPDFREFRASRSHPKSAADKSPVSETEATPEEELESAFQRLKTELAEELLQNVRRLSPAAFEQLVVDLMLAMAMAAGAPKPAPSRRRPQTRGSTASSTKIASAWM